ncbi:TPA: hypothetical protein OZI30_002701 [Staphylococcus aureus]|nr:hypothetical protein [Staphylococcus aureus]HCX2870135.1 hypothetical protein [Staphylococcus aureus]HCX3242632.1 hypothetical protein [Staphylococcus aureus]
MSDFKKTPIIIVVIGSIMILAFQEIQFLGFIGVVIFIIGIVLLGKEIHHQDCIKLIEEINTNLKELGYTEKEIKERQHELRKSSKSELKQRKRQTEVQIERKKEDKFFEPLDEK